MVTSVYHNSLATPVTLSLGWVAERLQHTYMGFAIPIPHHRSFLKTWPPSQPNSNVCHFLPGVAPGSRLTPALYEKAQAPE